VKDKCKHIRKQTKRCVYKLRGRELAALSICIYLSPGRERESERTLPLNCTFLFRVWVWEKRLICQFICLTGRTILFLSRNVLLDYGMRLLQAPKTCSNTACSWRY